MKITLDILVRPEEFGSEAGTLSFHVDKKKVNTVHDLRKIGLMIDHLHHFNCIETDITENEVYELLNEVDYRYVGFFVDQGELAMYDQSKTN
jgi:hypothetical protein